MKFVYPWRFFVHWLLLFENSDMLYKSDFSNFDNCSCENRWRFSKGLIEVLKGSVNKDNFKGIHFGIYFIFDVIHTYTQHPNTISYD